MVSLENEKSTKKGFSREEERERGGGVLKQRQTFACVRRRTWLGARMCVRACHGGFEPRRDRERRCHNLSEKIRITSVDLFVRLKLGLKQNSKNKLSK